MSRDGIHGLISHRKNVHGLTYHHIASLWNLKSLDLDLAYCKVIFDFVPKVNELYKSPFGRAFLELFLRILARQVQVHNQERFGGFNQHILDGIFVKSP